MPHDHPPNRQHACLLIIDMINEFSFHDAQCLFPEILTTAERIAELKRRAKAAGIPVVYVNDNFGIWRSDFKALVVRCLEEPCRGKEITKRLRPEDDDYFVLKPKHSGFYATPLELLLRFLKTERLILTGVAGNSCVLHTAADAYMRDFTLSVPSDCTVSTGVHANTAALAHMASMLKADIRPSSDLRISPSPYPLPAGEGEGEGCNTSITR